MGTDSPAADASGNSLVLGQHPDLRGEPEEVRLTEEGKSPGQEPSGRTVVSWKKE